MGLLVIDHLGLVRSSDRYRGSRVNEISEITAALFGRRPSKRTS